MSHFAKVENGIVTQVYVVEKDVLDLGLWGDPKLFVQCSYNTRGGIHHLPDSTVPSPDQSKALRKNYPGIGYTYDAVRDAFIAPKPFPSWVLNETTCLWEAPVPLPEDAEFFGYMWNEEKLAWELNTLYGLPQDANQLKISVPPYKAP